MEFQMPENVADIDGVPDRFKDFYIEDGDGGFKLESPKALKSAHNNSKRERMEALQKAESLETELTKFKDVDPDDYFRLRKASESGDLNANQKARLETMEANFNKKADELNGELNFYRMAAERGAVDSPLKSILIEKGVVKEDLDLMAHYAKPFIETKRDGDILNPIVVKPDGTQRWNEKNEPMTLFDLVDELRTRHPNNFKGNEQSGPGGDANTSHAPLEGKFAGKKVLEFSVKEKIEYQNKYGAKAYQERVAAEIAERNSKQSA